MRKIWLLLLFIGCALAGVNRVSAATTLPPGFDFTRPEATKGWIPAHQVEGLKQTTEGLEVTIIGDDPYFHSPARNFPTNTLLWLRLRVKSETGGGGQVFYFKDNPKEENSIHFRAAKNKWTEVRLPLPALGSGYRLRIDPPGKSGKTVFASMQFEPRIEAAPPTWPPVPSLVSEKTPAVAAGTLTLHPGKTLVRAFELKVDGKSMGFGYPWLRAAYFLSNEVHWVDFPTAKGEFLKGTDAQYRIVSKTSDRHGTEWTLTQTYKAQGSGAIAVTSSARVTQNREVLFLPLHVVAAGVQSFGDQKRQALFAGLEYLENEPSSSEADIIGPESKRQVPANHKITFPLMAIVQNGSYLGLAWQEHLQFSALFDSPDRTLNSGGHVMGIHWPESNGSNRREGALLPHEPKLLATGTELISRACILGGAGDTVVPAVQHYVALQGWPALPNPGMDKAGYLDLAARGWLDSKIRVGNQYRHAYWPRFNEGPAADVAVYETWLAQSTGNPARKKELLTAAAGALSLVPVPQYFNSGVSHVRTPTAVLAFNQVRENMGTARSVAQNALKHFQTDGAVHYRKAPDHPDYARTYWQPHANGMTARSVCEALAAAAFCGDRSLMDGALQRLRGMNIYERTVPRGAQTWEIPLHTPDILGSAHLIRAYVMGYELTGDKFFLDQANYWAWTGVPFVYLVSPTEHPVGLYSTIAVLGATSWRAPVWFGQPVQWCGMVYADALYQLSRIDPSSPWKQLADGITIAGLQHTWKTDDLDRVGLLPDFYLLQAQQSDGPAINPGTVGAGAIRLFGNTSLYELRAARQAGVIIHVPGTISELVDRKEKISFVAHGWPETEYSLLMNGFTKRPLATRDGKELSPAQMDYDKKGGWAVFRLKGQSKLEVRF